MAKNIEVKDRIENENQPSSGDDSSFLQDKILQLKLIVKQMILNFKYLFNNKKNIMVLCLIPLFSLTIPMVFVPIFVSMPAFVTTGVILPAGLIYCSTTYEWRKGTLYPTLLISKNSKFTFYASSFLTMLIVSISLYLTTLFALIVLNGLGFLASDWGMFYNSNQFVKFGNLYLLPGVYSVFEMTLVVFSILFLVQNIVRTNIAMYSFLFGIVLIQIVFGGMFTQYFLRTTVDDILLDPVTVYPLFRAMMFPESVYWVSYVFDPLFSASMHIQAFSSKWLWRTDINMPAYGVDNNFVFWVWETKANTDGILPSSQMVKWNILWFTPYIWTGVFGVSGVLASKLMK